MLVFGDRSKRVDPRRRLAQVEQALDSVARMRAGIDRHGAIASVLIGAGQLLQGVADAEFRERGRDCPSAEPDALAEWVTAIAHMLRRSWDSGFADVGEVPVTPQLAQLPGSVDLKEPEGFAFYALYPEAYLEAARRLRLIGPPRVIGIRSIGATLGAVVAAALDARPPVTLRPFGDPFARQVAIDPALKRGLLDPEAHYIVVDEGPGQSGSSFGAVADWLEQRGVPLDRIAFLPSHGGPLGPQASRAHRQRWQAAQRQVADFGDRLPALVAGWAGSAVGEPDEISGGEWRRLLFAGEREWPPVIPMFERRKILLGHGDGRVLARFAGLGGAAEAKLDMARVLHAEGFVAEPLGVAHGFLFDRWHEDAKPLTRADRPVTAIGRYIGIRARLFPASQADGASIPELSKMARRNIALALGSEAARRLNVWEPRIGALQARVRPVRGDNRLDPHEWLRTAEGKLLKTDALDHHRAHDLIGCQDMVWDVAGATVEWDFEPTEAEQLIDAAEQASGRDVDRELLAFCLTAYAAFRLGLATIGAELAVSDSAEGDRLTHACATYLSRLSRLLECSSRATRHESLVD